MNEGAVWVLKAGVGVVKPNLEPLRQDESLPWAQGLDMGGKANCHKCPDNGLEVTPAPSESSSTRRKDPIR
jgi:hypothetical protein